MLYVIGFAGACLLGTGYYFSCRWWPYGPCLACLGHPGRNPGSNGRRWGRCRRCKGAGKRIRFGARVFRSIREGRQ